MTQDRLAELRDLLHDEPSLSGWGRICAMLDTWFEEDAAGFGVAVAYIETHQERWPDIYRYAPLDWVDAFFEGGADLRCRLVRCLIVESRRIKRPQLEALRRALTRRDGAIHITQLELAKNHLGDLATEVLASSMLEDVELLAVRDNDITDAAVEALAASPYVGSLTSLQLSNNRRVTGDALVALAASTGLTRLETLQVYYSPIEDHGFITFLRSPLVRQLKRLVLAGNDLTDLAAEAIAESPDLAGLEELAISGGRIGAAGVRALRQSPNLSDALKSTMQVG